MNLHEEQERKLTETAFGDLNTSDKKIIVPVIEEEIKVTKRTVETGRVNVAKTINETIETFEVPLSEEKVLVERIAKNELVDTIPPSSRYEGDVMIIPVLKEVAIVEKRIMLVEEIRISTSRTEKTETHEVTVRKEEINITRTNL